MNNYRSEAYDKILCGNSKGWYEFSEKMMRGYARLRAEQQGVELGADHPTLRPNTGKFVLPRLSE